MSIVEDKVHIHDLQATILNCLGFDHTRLTYRHMGRDFRLTDVAGNAAKKMLAWISGAPHQNAYFRPNWIMRPAPAPRITPTFGFRHRSSQAMAAKPEITGRDVIS